MLRKHESEKEFGIQIAGGHTDNMARFAKVCDILYMLVLVFSDDVLFFDFILLLLLPFLLRFLNMKPSRTLLT